MLEQYFVKPQTVDRVRACWIGEEIERYVGWLAEHGYAARCVFFRVPLLVAFGEFAWARGARTVGELPAHVEEFVAQRVAERFGQSRARRPEVAREIRGPLEQMLAVVVPGYEGSGRTRRPLPFVDVLPGFFDYLVAERGLRPATIEHYRHQLDRFEAYLLRIGAGVEDLCPATLSAYVAERSGVGLSKSTVRDTCGVLRVFLRFAHREGVIASNLSVTVEWPQVYRLSDIPRSISWAQLGEVLAGVDRRTPAGKRDYAIVLS